MAIKEFINQHSEKGYVSFHMPGHKGRGLFDAYGFGGDLDNLVSGDITEIHGADNLFQPEGIIRETMNRYKDLYGSKESFLSVNGSTSGIIAGILSVVSQGDRIGIARNSHKSVFNGVRIAGGVPLYIYPEIVDEWGISGEVRPESVKSLLDRAALQGEPCKAVLITSPNYHGVCSDIKSISEIVHEHGAFLIVDQAHGAHLRFLEPALSADLCGADIVIESVHKTLASFTQTGIVNIYNDKLVERMADKLQMISSTSPSYMLLKSLDINAELIEKQGDRLFNRWKKNITRFTEEAEALGAHIFTHPKQDVTKILIDMKNFGVTGDMLNDILMKRRIFSELYSKDFIMCMTGIGNSDQDYNKLLTVIKEIAARGPKGIESGNGNPEVKDIEGEKYGTLSVLMNKEREAVSIPEEYETVHYSECEGRVSYEGIIPYPPGAPLIAPGEVMDTESLSLAYELRRRGENVMGMTKDGFIKAGK